MRIIKSQIIYFIWRHSFIFNQWFFVASIHHKTFCILVQSIWLQINISKSEKKNSIYSPTTFNLNVWLIFGSVDTWHSYVPESRGWGVVIRNVHSSEPSVCNDWNLWSFVYVKMPTVKMCKSRFRNQVTCEKKNGKKHEIYIFMNGKSCHKKKK